MRIHWDLDRVNPGLIKIPGFESRIHEGSSWIYPGFILDSSLFMEVSSRIRQGLSKILWEFRIHKDVFSIHQDLLGLILDSCGIQMRFNRICPVLIKNPSQIYLGLIRINYNSFRAMQKLMRIYPGFIFSHDYKSLRPEMRRDAIRIVSIQSMAFFPIRSGTTQLATASHLILPIILIHSLRIHLCCGFGNYLRNPTTSHLYSSAG